MFVTIWILKSLLALLFLLVGASKLLLPKVKLLDKGMKGLIGLDPIQIKMAGLLEVLGSMALVLPSVLNFNPLLTTISALSLGFTMIIAAIVNRKLGLSIVPNLLILFVCLFIAYFDRQ